MPNNMSDNKSQRRTDQRFKFDADKPMMDLIPPKAIIRLGRVMSHGYLEYGVGETWRNVEQCRYVAALLRHLLDHMSGDYYDKKSGMPHLWHVLANAAFLAEYADE